MGTGTDDLNLTGKPPEVIERAIAVKRAHADRVARELDRRRHHLTDWRWQVSHHGSTIAIAAGVLALVAGVAIATTVRRARARRRPAALLARLRRAVARIIDRPDAVAAQPSTAQRIAVAALGPLATAGAKLLVRRLGQTPASRGNGEG